MTRSVCNIKFSRVSWTLEPGVIVPVQCALLQYFDHNVSNGCLESSGKFGYDISNTLGDVETKNKGLFLLKTCVEGEKCPSKPQIT